MTCACSGGTLVTLTGQGFNNADSNWLQAVVIRVNVDTTHPIIANRSLEVYYYYCVYVYYLL